jgi:hypothetical protein
MVRNALVTVTEAVEVVGSLGLSLTPRQVRYLNLVPAQRISGRNGGRLHDATDVTVLAVFAALLAKVQMWGLPRWSARAAVRYREAELRQAIQRRSPRFLIVDAIRGTAALSETADVRDAAIDVRALMLAVSQGVRSCRAGDSDVWTGAEYVPIEDLHVQ